MSPDSLPDPRSIEAGARVQTAAPVEAWRASLLAVAILIATLGTAFLEEARAAVRVWNASTAYNHCWLVLPIATWLAWSRRHRLHALGPQASWSAALLVLPFGAGWLVAERLGIMEGRQLAALAILELGIVAILGWRVSRAMAAPLAYLVFLVPVGAFLTPWLQEVTTWFVDVALDLARIPHYVDGFIIETPNASFLVAEACAGLRFLIATVALGAFYALEFFRSPVRRLTVFALSFIVPVIANGFRATGLVLIGHYRGDAQAALADHITYGWVFFSLVLLLLILAGLPFREDRPAGPVLRDEPGVLRGNSWRGAAGAAALALGLGLAAPAAAAGLAWSAGQGPREMPVALAPAADCIPAFGGSGLECGGVRVSARLVVFPERATWAMVSRARHRVLTEGDLDRGWRLAANDGSALWHIVPGTGGAHAIAAFLSGRPTGGGLGSRVRQARNSLGLGEGRPVLMVVVFQGSVSRRRVDAILQVQAHSLGSAAASSGRSQ